mgnify:CR=1 FL=1
MCLLPAVGHHPSQLGDLRLGGPSNLLDLSLRALGDAGQLRLALLAEIGKLLLGLTPRLHGLRGHVPAFIRLPGGFVHLAEIGRAHV